jgi:hypothetical protein
MRSDIMACCGKKRAQLSNAFPHGRVAGPAPLPAAPPSPRAAAPVVFEYGGGKGVTALGPVTRRLYRFDQPRARVEVDARDAPAIAAVPNLRRVR